MNPLIQSKNATILPVLIALMLGCSALSQSTALAEADVPHPLYTWSLSPTNNDWNTPTNWMPVGVPDTISEGAVFGSSSVTNIVANAVVHSIEFNPGASQYTITGNLTFNGGGVINNSGIVQTFNGTFRFDKFGTTAGSLVTFTNTSFSVFGKGTSAGSATYTNNDKISFYGGHIPVWHTTAGEATIINNGFIYIHKADAGSATFTNNGGATFGADGGVIGFTHSSALSSTIINNGGAVFGGKGAQLIFRHNSSADSATLIANGGAGPGSGATILFMSNSTGDSARVEVFGNGNLDVSRPDPINDAVGSIEGDGLVFIGSSNLSVGSNNLNTTFDGIISESGGVQEGTGGSLTKTGTGTLTLTSANDYSGGTTVESGSLFVNNTTGFATGSGLVNVLGGTLAGAGTITGSLTVGNGSSVATLAPGANSSTIGTLTVQGALKLDANSSYQAELDSTALAADNVTATVVIIGSGAQITLTDLGATTLPNGTTFTLIENNSGTAMIGTFSNLADGSTVTIGDNTFQASYEGGDGNDLTLTVVP